MPIENFPLIGKFFKKKEEQQPETAEKEFDYNKDAEEEALRYGQERRPAFDRNEAINPNPPIAEKNTANAPATPTEEAPRSEVEPNPEIAPTPEKPRDKAYVVDISEIAKSFSWRQGEEKLRDILDNSNFAKRIWVRMAEKGYLLKYYKEALNAIQNDKNLLAEIDARILKSKVNTPAGSKDKSYEILDSLIEQYVKELTEADEKGELVNNPEVDQKIAELFYQYTTGSLSSRQDFDNEFETTIIPLLKGKNFTKDEKRKGEAKGLMYANNLFAMAEKYKDAIDKKIQESEPNQKENILAHIKSEMRLDLNLGLKQKDLYETKPKGTLKWYEKFVDTVQNIPILNKIVANPVTYGIVGGIIGGGGKTVTRIAAGAGLASVAAVAPWAAPLILGAAFGGVYAGIRRSKDLSYDRGMDLKRSTLGAASGGKRTDKIREYDYSRAEASELIAKLTNLRGNSEINQEGKELVAEVISRLKVSQEQSVDLIKVDQKEGAETKTNIISMTELMGALGEVKQKFGLSEQDPDLAKIIEEYSKNFREDITNKDKDFNKFKRNESVKSGIFGAIAGLAAGAIGQHAAYAAKEWITGTPIKAESALEHLYHVIKGDKTYFSGKTYGALAHLTDGRIVKMNLPVETQLNPKSGNIHELVDAGGKRTIGEIAFDNNGKLNQDSVKLLENNGITITENAPVDARVSSGKSAIMNQLAEHKRVDWHDEPGKKFSSFFNKLIEHEGKQQMLYLEKGKDGLVDVNVSKIIKNLEKNLNNQFDRFGTNPDGSVDKKLTHLLRQLMEWRDKGELAKHLQVAIIPNEEANKKGLSLLLEGAERGKIKFTKELSDMFSNPESLKYLKHPFKYIELRLDGHVLATSVGEDISSLQPNDIFLTPPISKWDVPPVLPFARRKALEPEKKPRTPGYYGAGSAEEILADFRKEGIKLDSYQIIKRDNKRFLLDKDGNEIHRDVKRENERINAYLDSQDPVYLEELKKLNFNLEPMDENCRICINIPARMEAANISNLLEQFSKQVDTEGNSLDTKLFEINVIVNKKKSETGDDSMKLIEEWKKAHPDIKVNAIDVSFEDSKACVGLARKYITDLSLLRSISRKKQTGPLYIETEDADMFGVDKRMVEKLIKGFDRDASVDVLRGIQDRQPEIMQKNDLLFFSRRLWDFMEVFLRNQKYRSENYPQADFTWHRTVSGGWNTAYTAEAYAQIGGYNETRVIGEDMEIGQRISVLRGFEDPESKRFIPNTQTTKASGIRSSSSPRRFIDALSKKISPYDDFENQALKYESLDQLLGKIKTYETASMDQLDKYQEQLTVLADFFKNSIFKGNPKWTEVMHRALTQGMGMKENDHYILTSEGITLTPQGMQKIITNFKEYKDDERWKLGYSRQNTPLGKIERIKRQTPDTGIETIKLTPEAESKQEELETVSDVSETTVGSKPEVSQLEEKKKVEEKKPSKTGATVERKPEVTKSTKKKQENKEVNANKIEKNKKKAGEWLELLELDHHRGKALEKVRNNFKPNGGKFNNNALMTIEEAHEAYRNYLRKIKKMNKDEVGIQDRKKFAEIIHKL